MFKALFNNNRPTETRTLPRIENINAAQLNDRLKAGEPLLLLDVRSPMEYQFDGHIEGSRLLPLQALNGRINELPKDQTVVCVCRSGNRSQFAAEQLAMAGFENVINLRGGIIGWKMSGLPTQ